MTKNIITLKEMLTIADKEGFGVGSFSARYTPMIKPILQAAQKNNSPVIVQLATVEIEAYKHTLKEIAETFYQVVEEEGITVPVTLHLDHTEKLDIIKEAIDVGFTSVMIDASAEELEKNIAITKEVVEYAHAKNVSVEAELGRIGAGSENIETKEDIELYTVPEEAEEFVNRTNIDALAVSVGTAHGVYITKNPTISYERLTEIGKLLQDTAIVLHGGSGIPADMIQKAVNLEYGSVSKINIATDLEIAFMKGIGSEDKGRLEDNAEAKRLPKDVLAKGLEAVENIVSEKINTYLLSQNKAGLYPIKK